MRVVYKIVKLSNYPIKRHSPVLYALFTRGWTSMGEIAVVFVRGIKMNSKRAVKIFTILVSNHFKTQNGSHLVYGLQEFFKTLLLSFVLTMASPISRFFNFDSFTPPQKGKR